MSDKKESVSGRREDSIAHKERSLHLLLARVDGDTSAFISCIANLMCDMYDMHRYIAVQNNRRVYK